MSSGLQFTTPFRFSIDAHSGVPLYRQIIDQVLVAVSSGALHPGDQLPTVRQVAVDLSINPNTVMRAYREMEIRGLLTTQQGTGTFISAKPAERDDGERRRRLAQLAGEFAARVGSEGYALREALECLHELSAEHEDERRG